jgi:DNA polymerase I-like protein with 3'-5' exonuclease and polymerase domains
LSEIPVLKPLVLNPPLNVTVIRDEAGLANLKDFFNRCKEFGFDIETTPLKDYFYRRTRTIQFGNQAEQYVIDLLAFCDGDSDALYKAQGYYGLNLEQHPKLKAVIDTITPVLVSRDYLKIGVSLQFEYHNFYWQFGIRSCNFFDCSMVEKCIWAGAHSMKDYSYYGMEEMMGRYFLVQIDKELQASFNLQDPLTPEQIDYAALDTRVPIALRQVQLLILQGHTYKSLLPTNPGAAKFLKNIDPIVTGDNLTTIAQIENDAIGAFQDMHVHGERIDRARWMDRIAKKEEELKKVISDELDPVFIPICGRTSEAISDEKVAEAEAAWKALNVITDDELKLKGAMRGEKDLTRKLELDAQRGAIEAARKSKKEELKTVCSDLKKRRTVINNLVAKCEGEALINYGSGAQLLEILKGIKGLKNIADTEDETLEKFSHIPVMAALRKYRTLSKEIGTYGNQWVTQWTTKPCKDEGWLHPGDGRLHCVFNQYDAETGRSTSEKPNGQNLPQDKEVRSCFIADPPDESIRISVCCEADTCSPLGSEVGYICNKCNKQCETKPEDYAIVTADMSGAELRIIAELADDPVWIEAFGRGEDVHSVGTEILYGERWATLAIIDNHIIDKKTGKEIAYTCEYYKPHDEDSIKKNPKGTIGQPMRQKCECPEHKKMRDGNKSTNFLLAYGGGPTTLAVRIKVSVDEARELMALHASKFPKIWEYLERSGNMAKMLKKSFDMFGRRRLFPEPTWERATARAKDDFEDKLKRPKEEADANKERFAQLHGRKPSKDELWILTHFNPSNKQIAKCIKGMHSSIERQGKNHCIQSANASIAKLAMGSGHCSKGLPFLWHTLPKYKAKLIKFVHDELVVQCPKRLSQQVAAEIGDAFKRAAAERMSKVVMEFDFNIAAFWKK